MRLLAIDLGAKLGYAHGDPFDPGNAPPISGVHKIQSAPLTKRLIATERWAIDLCTANGITDVIIEKPFIENSKSEDAIYSMLGQAIMIGVAATKLGCYCALVEMQVWRSRIGLPISGPKNILSDPKYGDTFRHRKDGLKAAKRQYVKDMAMKFARKMGSDPSDDNEGDAICIWHSIAQEKRAKADAPKFDLFGDLSI